MDGLPPRCREGRHDDSGEYPAAHALTARAVNEGCRLTHDDHAVPPLVGKEARAAVATVLRSSQGRVANIDMISAHIGQRAAFVAWAAVRTECGQAEWTGLS